MPIVLSAQIVLERSVVGSLGGTESLGGGKVIEFTAGEAVVQTRAGGDIVLTQGFHQSGLFIPLTAEAVVTNASCPTATDGTVEIARITGCTPPYLVHWSNGHEGMQVNGLSPGFYSYTVTGPNCEFTEEVEVLSGSPDNCRLHFYTGFSPNGDGENDDWTIENITLPEFIPNRVSIFNRWGQQTNSWINYDNAQAVWRGRSDRDAELPAGTYFYIADTPEGIFKGYVELIR